MTIKNPMSTPSVIYLAEATFNQTVSDSIAPDFRGFLGNMVWSVVDDRSRARGIAEEQAD
jgi:hypothetical protein